MTRDKFGRFQKGDKTGLKTRFQKDNKVNLGKKNGLGHKVSLEERKKIGLRSSGEKNHMWRGDDVKYRALHQWVNKYLPSPGFCGNCLKPKKLDLANITGNYNREFKNWKYLCRSCHIINDRGRSK